MSKLAGLDIVQNDVSLIQQTLYILYLFCIITCARYTTLTSCRDFCFEGSCELCQLEVQGGALELGPKAQLGRQA